MQLKKKQQEIHMSQVYRLVSLKWLLGKSLKQLLMFRVLENSSDMGGG